MPTKKKANAPTPWNAVRVIVPDGHTYLVGRPAVEDDYVQILLQDGLSLGHATEKVRDMDHDTMCTWFNEQFNLEDVKAMGTRLTRPTYDQLIAQDYPVNNISDCEVDFINV